MTAASISAMAGAIARRREPRERWTGQPVRGHSVLVGDPRETRLRSTTDRRSLRRLERYVDGRLAKLKREAPGPRPRQRLAVLQLLDRLIAVAMKMRGRIEITVASLAEMAGLSESCVHQAKRWLADLGVLKWQRRCKPAEGGEGHARGPAVEQTSNVYTLHVPAEVMAREEAPPPVDFETDRAARAAEIRAWELAEQSDRSPAIRRAEAKIAAGGAGRRRDSTE